MVKAGVAANASGYDIQLHAVLRAYCWLCDRRLPIFTLRWRREGSIR